MSAWIYLAGLVVAWAFGWSARDVSFDPQKVAMKSKHDTELAERDAEIKRLRAQVAKYIGTCCGDASHGCEPWRTRPDKDTEFMMGL